MKWISCSTLIQLKFNFVFYLYFLRFWTCFFQILDTSCNKRFDVTTACYFHDILKLSHCENTLDNACSTCCDVTIACYFHSEKITLLIFSEYYLLRINTCSFSWNYFVWIQRQTLPMSWNTPVLYYNPFIIPQNKQPSLQKNPMDRIFMFSSLDA